jgi:bacillithiol synthase
LRHGIEPSDYGFFLRGSRQRFTMEEMLKLANTVPENFSPNVLLRPVVQDFVFPTAAYVGGPSEVAYFAQLQPVYDHFQLPMPIIFPRASISIFEKKIQKLFNKFDLQLTSMYDSPQDLFAAVVGNGGNDDHIQAFERFRAQLLTQLKELPELATSVSVNLTDPAAATVQNIIQLLTNFGEKLKQTEMEKHSVILRQLEKMQMYLSPEGKPQERQINILTYLNRYGMDFLPKIDEYCQPFPAEHRLLML